MNLSFLKKQLFAPLYASLTVLVILLLGQEILSIAISVSEQRTSDDVNQAFYIKRESERLLRSATEEKAALRGYLLTNDNYFIKQYQDGRNTFDVSMTRLSQLLEPNTPQWRNLLTIETFHNQWLRQYAQPIVNGSLDECNNCREYTRKDSSLDTMREAVNQMLVYEKEVLIAQNRQLKRLDRLNALGLFLNGFSIGILVIGVSVNFILLRRRVINPLRHLMRVGKSWGSGRLEQRISHISEDEMGCLAMTLNGMAKDLEVRQKRIQKRNQQLEDLIGTLSHDLRTPLLANRSTLKAMVRGAFGPTNDLLTEVLEDCQDANENLINLVEILLDISRYEASGGHLLSYECLDWNKICNRVIAWIQKSSNNKCRLKIAIVPDVPDVCGDAIEIQRVLQNLLENAVRVSDPGQIVTIEIKAHGTKAVHVAVSDQGPGLKQQEANQLFYRFSQGADRQGRAGLGLYLCRQIIEAHGGTISLQSHLDHGTTVCFTLPLASDVEANLILQSMQN